MELPEFKVENIKVKVDTGARSSCLHAFDVGVVQRDGEEWVNFSIRPNQYDDELSIAATARLLEYRSVRSSSGHAELRPVVQTQVRLGKRTWIIELTLTNRDRMGFRMLLGRQAIRRRFLVDPEKSFLVSHR